MAHVSLIDCLRNPKLCTWRIIDKKQSPFICNSNDFHVAFISRRQITIVNMSRRCQLCMASVRFHRSVSQPAHCSMAKKVWLCQRSSTAMIFSAMDSVQDRPKTYLRLGNLAALYKVTESFQIKMAPKRPFPF